jgi:dihydrofolate reductase
MIISLVASMSKDRVIGVDNKLPWHIPSELKYFKSITQHKPVIMGRSTFESIGRPLPNRVNIVLTKNNKLSLDNVITCNNLEEAIEIAKKNIDKYNNYNDEICIIGGASIYAQSIDLANKMYISIIKGDYIGDTYFPEFNQADWKLDNQMEYAEYTTAVYIKEK